MRDVALKSKSEKAVGERGSVFPVGKSDALMLMSRRGSVSSRAFEGEALLAVDARVGVEGVSILGPNQPERRVRCAVPVCGRLGVLVSEEDDGDLMAREALDCRRSGVAVKVGL